MKLGKLPYKHDDRTVKLENYLKALPPVPEFYDVDSQYAFLRDDFVFANDKWGNCAIAARAHMTLRFESFEQNREIPITDNEVLAEYWLEQGASPVTRTHFCKTIPGWSSQPDGGLTEIGSLKAWQNRGWTVGGQSYNIYAYGSIDLKNHDSVKAGIYLLNGLYIGLQLPISAQAQWNVGLPWDFVNYNNTPGSWGGHAVYIVAYNSAGPVCYTWGKRQQITWSFWDTYNDETWGVVDNKDSKNSIVDTDKLDSYLNEIKK